MRILELVAAFRLSTLKKKNVTVYGGFVVVLTVCLSSNPPLVALSRADSPMYMEMGLPALLTTSPMWPLQVQMWRSWMFIFY